MIRQLGPIRLIVLAILTSVMFSGEIHAQIAGRDNVIKVTVKAGDRDRVDTPIRFEVPEDRIGELVRKDLKAGPVGLLLSNLPETPDDAPEFFQLAQLERDPATSRLHVKFVIPSHVPRGKEAHYQVSTYAKVASRGPIGFTPSWAIDKTESKALELKYNLRLVFRYNAAPISSPNYGPIQNRDAYIHPAYSPSGALITGDFSSSHPHHRGFFLAYEKTKTGELTPDFWNIHYGTGKIHSEGFGKVIVGPVTARFTAQHRWDAKDKATGNDVTVLREKWDVEAYAIPNAPYWLFDITSTQQAVDRPLELLPYRYGGMAYRGPEPFVKGTLDVLTSENLNRKTGDQKPARWVDLTGPIAEGSDKYAGAMIVDHPSNPNYPNVARIHPTTLPFFCYVPAHDKPVTIAADTPSVFRYRVLIHDGHPDKDLDERIARDFAEPPAVVVE